jgi:dTDP-4-amino-4,6-dideoxygalactose transaminase
MIYPRQKLYNTNHIGYLKAIITRGLNSKEQINFEEEFYNLTNIKNSIPLSRGRLGLYFAIKNFVSKDKNKVLMNSFTIFDVINMVVCGGGIPVFCDSQSKSTPHITLDDIKKNADSKTAVVVITHYHNVNPDIEDISQWCRENNIKLIEDCAISFGSFINNKAVGSFGDASYFSFGLFKFVSTYFGGAVWFKDLEIRDKVLKEISSWDRMGEKDLRSYFFKGIKLNILMNKYIFNYLTFPLFKFGYIKDIKFIKKQAVNDPNPYLYTSLPKYYQKRASTFQIKEFVRQFKSIKINKDIRLENAKVYFDILSTNQNIEVSNPTVKDSFLNFPIVLKNHNRDDIVKKIMNSDFDISIYFYRNCADLDCFEKYKQTLPNIEYFVSNIITLPTYPGIDKSYIRLLANKINEIIK